MINRILFTNLALSIFYSAHTLAETFYVTDNWRFELRELPCWECTISGSLPTGTELTVLETEEPVEGWQYIETKNGSSGWIFQNYLSELPSARSQLDEALALSSLATAKQSLLEEQLERLTLELQKSGIDIKLVEITSEDGSVVIHAPRVIGNLSSIGYQNEELLRNNQLLQNELDLRAAEIDRLKDNTWKSHFIYGGGTVFAGVILCLILTRIRPRKGYSEWA